MKNKRHLTSQEFIDLAYLVMHCASLALTESKREYNRNKAGYYYELTFSDMNPLFECYSKSHFRFGTGSDYKNYISNQAFSVISDEFLQSFRNQTRQHIMIPFAFYSLILQNESNRSTVLRRANKVREAIRGQSEMPSWKKINPYVKVANTFCPDKKQELHYSEMLSALQSNADGCNLKNNLMLSNTAKDAIAYCSKLDKKLHILNYCSYTARCGLFLYDILKQFAPTNTLDTIILMLCINDYFGTISGSSLISEIYVSDQNNPNMVMRPHSGSNLLYTYAKRKTYDAHFKENDVLPIPVYYIGSDQNPDILQKLDILRSRKSKFQEFYSYITENFSFETQDFIDYFIDPKALACFVESNDRLINYMKASSKLLKLLAEIEEASVDTNSILIACRLVSKYNTHFEIDTPISEFYSIEDELAHLVNGVEAEDEGYTDGFPLLSRLFGFLSK